MPSFSQSGRALASCCRLLSGIALCCRSRQATYGNKWSALFGTAHDDRMSTTPSSTGKL